MIKLKVYLDPKDLEIKQSGPNEVELKEPGLDKLGLKDGQGPRTKPATQDQSN